MPLILSPLLTSANCNKLRNSVCILKLKNSRMADTTVEAADKNVEIWKVKKLIKSLEAARGNGTSMISLIIPPGESFCVEMLIHSNISNAYGWIRILLVGCISGFRGAGRSRGFSGGAGAELTSLDSLEPSRKIKVRLRKYCSSDLSQDKNLFF